MLVCIKVILTIFKVTFTLGTITESQIRIILLCSSAYRAAMTAAGLNFFCCLIHLSLELLFPSDLLWIVSGTFSHNEINEEVQKRHHNGDLCWNTSENKAVNKECTVKESQPFCLDRYHKEQQELVIREGRCICKE